MKTFLETTGGQKTVNMKNSLFKNLDDNYLEIIDVDGVNNGGAAAAITWRVALWIPTRKAIGFLKVNEALLQDPDGNPAKLKYRFIIRQNPDQVNENLNDLRDNPPVQELLQLINRPLGGQDFFIDVLEDNYNTAVVWRQGPTRFQIRFSD